MAIGGLVLVQKGGFTFVKGPEKRIPGDGLQGIPMALILEIKAHKPSVVLIRGGLHARRSLSAVPGLRPDLFVIRSGLSLQDRISYPLITTPPFGCRT